MPGDLAKLKEGARTVLSLVDHPLWMVATLLPILVVRAISAAVPGHYDADCWWVAAAGREILRTGAVPTVNGFSFVDGTQPWIMHEWLMGPLFAWGIAKLGPPFLALLALVVGAVTMTVALSSIVRESRSVLSAWVSAALLVGCFSDRFVTARPTGLALVFPVLLLAVALRPSFGLREVLLSVAVMLAWTNAHGSFPLGLLILLAGALGAFSPVDRRARAVALGLGALATLCNPYGLRLHRFVFHYLAGDEPVFALVHRRIAEFSPLFGAGAHDWAGAQLLAGIAGLAVLTISGLLDRQARVRALVSVPLLVLGARNARHVELAGLLSVMLLAPATNALASRLERAVEVPQGKERLATGTNAFVPRWLRWLAAAAGVVGLVLWCARAMTRPSDDALLGRLRPAAILTSALPAGAHVLAPFDTSGLVTWLAFPRGVLTFADSRNDCFRASTLETFFDLETAPLGATDLARVLDGAGVTSALLPDPHPQAAAMAHLPGWHPAGREGDWTLFARGEPRD